jgi:hypothetical protein
MLASKSLVLACGLASLFATGLRAEDVKELRDTHLVYMNAAGQVTTHKVSAKAHDTVIKHGKALSAGAMIYRHGGRLYLIEDTKQPNGKMLSDTRQEWEND